jgi:RNA binding exosome subunit
MDDDARNHEREDYNKINGAIRRHFGKQMNKETKLRIHNITPKAALKFGNEAWVLKRGTTFRSSTDKIFETLTWNNKIRIESMY